MTSRQIIEIITWFMKDAFEIDQWSAINYSKQQVQSGEAHLVKIEKAL